jgi:predicted DNA binding CopG/RHH family protein
MKKNKPEQKTQVTISMEKSTWEKIQDRASEDGISASGYLRQLFFKEEKRKTK